MFESMRFNKVDVFEKIKDQFIRGNISSKERSALLQIVANHCRIRQSDIFVKWVSQNDMQKFNQILATMTEIRDFTKPKSGDTSQ